MAQLIPAYDELVEEAIKEAKEIKNECVKTRIRAASGTIVSFAERLSDVETLQADSGKFRVSTGGEL